MNRRDTHYDVVKLFVDLRKDLVLRSHVRQEIGTVKDTKPHRGVYLIEILGTFEHLWGA